VFEFVIAAQRVARRLRHRHFSAPVPRWAIAPTRPVALWLLLWSATVGLGGEQFASLLSAHGGWLASRAKSMVRGDGWQLLKNHQAAADDVVIVTGSSRILALCRALGLENVQVVGSTFRPCAGGWVVNEHCAGARKVDLLAAAGVNPPWDIVYTDSASDLPLLKLAGRRCVVNPRRRVVQVLTRALGAARLEVLQWR